MRIIAGVLLSSLVIACASTPPPAAAPRSSGYGLSIQTPVEVCEPRGERAYLQRLRCADGSPPTFSRRGSGPMRSAPKTPEEERQAADQMFRTLEPGEPDFHMLDTYEVQCGSQVTEVKMDMYHCNQPPPDQAPPGFTIVPNP